MFQMLFHDDIMLIIISFLDVKTIISVSEISRSYNKLYEMNMKSLLCKSLSVITKFRIDKYNIPALQKLHEIQVHKSRIMDINSPLLLLTESGKVYSYGPNLYGLLEINEQIIYDAINIPELKDIIQLVEVNSTNELFYQSLVLTKQGNVYVKRYNSKFYQKFYNLDNIRHIKPGYETIYFLTNNGHLYKSIINQHNYGKLLAPIFIRDFHNIIDISCCSFYALFLSAEGKVYIYDSYNRIGTDNIQVITTKVIQIASGPVSSLILTEDGKVYKFNLTHSYSIPTLIINIPNILQIACSLHCTILLTNDGKVYKWESGDIIIPLPELNNIIQISDRGFHKLWY